MDSVIPETEGATREGSEPPARRSRRRGRRKKHADTEDHSSPPTPEQTPLGLTGPEPEVHPAQVRTGDIDVDALKVIRRLRRHGHRAYLVGGGVRDLLLGVKPKDFDIGTSARPAEVRALFRNCRVIGRRFRLAHVLFGGGKIIEVATFRRDPSQDIEDPRRSEEDLLIRHDNVFGEPHEDAYRRDFTMNGLFFDTEDQTVIDYVGGMEDLSQRVVRTIGAPDVRFREDPVRMLRAIKFSARLDLGIDPDVYDALVAQRAELARAARPRLLEEVLRLLRGGAAHRSLWLMWETGALHVLLPALAIHLDDDSREARQLWGRLSAIDTLHRADALPPDPVLFAALLLGPIEDAMRDAKNPTEEYEALMTEVLDTLAVPKRMKERIRNVVLTQRRLDAGRIRGLQRREYFQDAATLFAIRCDGRGQRRPEWLDAVASAEESPRPRRRRRRQRR